MRHARTMCLLACLLTLAGSPRAQTRTTPGYDVDFLGPELSDPVLQHAKETYVLFGCAYCHGVNLLPRGEAADLMHSALVGLDENADRIGAVLRAGIPQTKKLSPMPQFSDLSDQQIAAIARWIHYARRQGRLKELTEAPVAPGDAAKGKAYFEQTCRSCHSVDGDLASIGRTEDPAALRARILAPPGLDGDGSFRLDRLHDAKTAAARASHHRVLENVAREDIADLVSYLLRRN
jgi:mono/diheme cytochrome c family protein